MANRGDSDGESSMSGEESEEQIGNPSDEPKRKMSEYEKQRFSRIAENKARLEALGISKSAKALLSPSLSSSRKRRGKVNPSVEEDDDYRPGEADYDDDDDGEEEVDGDSDTEEDEFLPNSSKRKLKNKSLASKRKVLSKKNLNRSNSLGDEDSDDDDLKKAIALSLQDSVAGGSGTTPTKKRRNSEEAGSGKKKKPELVSRMQMTEDQLVIYFYQFDEAGKGSITVRDVEKMATLHDFTWTEEELQDMVRCFDIDKDRKLSLDEFRKIVTRCRMLKES